MRAKSPGQSLPNLKTDISTPTGIHHSIAPSLRPSRVEVLVLLAQLRLIIEALGAHQVHDPTAGGPVPAVPPDVLRPRDKDGETKDERKREKNREKEGNDGTNEL